MINITSGQNPLIKEARSLKNRKDREEKGLFFIEGVRIIEEALKENTDLKYIIASDGFISAGRNGRLPDMLKNRGVNFIVVPDSLFRELSDTETPQGILAVVGIKKPVLSAAVKPDGLYAILDSIRDPGNMGTIIRTADAAGFDGIVVTKGSVDVFNPKVLRSTMGSVFHVPIYQSEDISDAISLFKSGGLKVYASHVDGTGSIYEADMTVGTVIIIGSEAEGISGEAVLQADLLVRVPMPGRAESLNASVAAGIMMFEAVRQRNKGI